jgi:hypothetical protein
MAIYRAESTITRDLAFYFENKEEYKYHFKKNPGIPLTLHKVLPDNPYQSFLFDRLCISQYSIYTWFDTFENFSLKKYIAFTYLLDNGYSVPEATTLHTEVKLFYGTPREYLKTLTINIPKLFEGYINYTRLLSNLKKEGYLIYLPSYELTITNPKHFTKGK